MTQTVYDYPYRVNQLLNDKNGEIFNTADYFDFYHTGIEHLPKLKEDWYFQVDRFENEQSDVIAFNFFEDENLNDIQLALNNDVYWWSKVADYETKEMILESKIKQVERLRKKPFSDSVEDQISLLHYKTIFMEEIENNNKDQKMITLPRFNRLSEVQNQIDEFIENRKVI